MTTKKRQRAARKSAAACSVHRFKLTVKGPRSRHFAWLYVLRCFAMRQPDGCEFILRKSKPNNGVRGGVTASGTPYPEQTGSP